MSLNKWKVWHVEISEDVLKIDKKLVTTKRGSYDQFLTKLKFFDPNKEGDGWIQKNFKNGLWIRGQNENNTRKIGHVSKDLMETMGENTRTGL